MRIIRVKAAAAERVNVLTAIFFSATMLVGSGLLFLVQPLCAKMVLPVLGGTPGVWNTCMVFFQAGLLAGYAYAHVGPRWLGPGWHALLHLGLLLAPFLVLPIALGREAPPGGLTPSLWLLYTLLWAVGLPFVMLASGAPLLQRWYAETGNRAERDPYFLYAASNLGSMVALLGYPFLVEPNLKLGQQSLSWTLGYGVWCVLLSPCAVQVWFRGKPGSKGHGGRSEAPGSSRPSPLTSRPSSSERLLWLLLALVPSSLMLSITAFLTTDIAAIPLFWVVPLAIYLLTFILVFAGKPLLPHPVFVRGLPLAVLILVVIKLTEATTPVLLLLGIHLLGLFWIGMACHGELARRRPAPERLTEYYLWLALGGVLGGMFSALAAPVIFVSVVEYPLMLVAACFLRPASAKPQAADALGPLILGIVTAGLILLGRSLALEPGPISVGFMFIVPIIICYTFIDRPIRFGLGMAALVLAAGLYPGVHGRTVYRARSFFGVHRVTEDAGFRKLVHGNTVHGMQSLDPAQRDVPLTYYHPHGPIGRALAALDGDPRLDRVGLIGLGTGALAHYVKPGQHWTFYEIDPEVIYIASPRARLFTYLRDCRGKVDVIAADGRLGLAGSTDQFGLLVVDAFNSDAIPVHLLTAEALQIYRSRLKPGGLLAFHFSNRYLDLEPVLANLAAAADPPMTCLAWSDRDIPEVEREQGRMAAQWAIMANNPADLKRLPQTPPTWQPARANPALQVWTDDFSNLVQVFKWRD